MNKNILTIVVILLAIALLASPISGGVQAKSDEERGGHNEERGGHDREHNQQCQEQDFMFYLKGTANLTGHVLVNNATMVVYKGATFVVNLTAFDPSEPFPLNIAAPQLVVNGVVIPQEYLAYEAILDGEVYKPGGPYSGIVNTTVRETIYVYTSANHNVNTLWGTLEMTAVGSYNSSDTLTAPLGVLVLHQSIVSGHGTLALAGVKITGTSGRIFGKIDAKPTEIAYIVRVGTIVGWPIKSDDGWTLFGSRALKAYPELREYVWQKNASLAPNGPYDKIGLHRLVKTGIAPIGVVFILGCPNWGEGEQRISNPSGDSWTKYENYSQAIYWANRGFDVYAIDYRSHFIPTSLNSSQVSFMADWGWDVWISDTKEAAEKVKEVSGSEKFFIAGDCTGGEAALNYATKYGKDDLKGIILLDATFNPVVGYPMVATLGNEANTYNLTTAINNMKASGAVSTGGVGFGNATKALSSYALQNPAAPAEYPPGTPLTPKINPLTNKAWANITEWYTYTIQYNVPSAPGLYSNPMGGYGNISQFEYCVANSEFIPVRLYLENQAMAGWVNCPYLAYDFNDHYKEINVPVLVFATGMFMNRTGAFRFVNGINNTDFTGVMLKNYGHADVYFGTYSARDVSEPAYQWMLGHSVVINYWSGGYGKIAVPSTWPPTSPGNPAPRHYSELLIYACHVEAGSLGKGDYLLVFVPYAPGVFLPIADFTTNPKDVVFSTMVRKGTPASAFDNTRLVSDIQAPLQHGCPKARYCPQLEVEMHGNRVTVKLATPQTIMWPNKTGVLTPVTIPAFTMTLNKFGGSIHYNTTVNLLSPPVGSGYTVYDKYKGFNATGAFTCEAWNYVANPMTKGSCFITMHGINTNVPP